MQRHEQMWNGRRRETGEKRRLAVDNWNGYKDMSSMSVAMTQVGVELNEELE